LQIKNLRIIISIRKKTQLKLIKESIEESSSLTLYNSVIDSRMCTREMNSSMKIKFVGPFLRQQDEQILARSFIYIGFAL